MKKNYCNPKTDVMSIEAQRGLMLPPSLMGTPGIPIPGGDPNDAT